MNTVPRSSNGTGPELEDLVMLKKSMEPEPVRCPTPTSRDWKSGRNKGRPGHTSMLNEVVLKRSTSSVADFRVKRSPSPASGKVKKIRAGSGPSTSEYYGRFDQDGRWLKTSKVSSRIRRPSRVKPSKGSSGTWPRAGTMRNGIVYQQPQSAPHTYVTEFFSSHAKWATPRASRGGPSYSQANRSSLAHANLSTQDGGMLNPTWVEWLQGFPSEWTVLES